MRQTGFIILLLLLFTPFLFPEESSDWDLLNEYLDVQIGKRFNFSIWSLFLMIDFDPVLLLDGVPFFPTMAILSKDKKFNTTTTTYQVIMAPYTTTIFGHIKSWDKYYADFFWKSDFAKNMGVTQEELKKIYTLRSNKRWLKIIWMYSMGGILLGTVGVFALEAEDYSKKVSAIFLLGSGLTAGLSELGIIIINKRIKEKMMKIVENLKIQ